MRAFTQEKTFPQAGESAMNGFAPKSFMIFASSMITAGSVWTASEGRFGAMKFGFRSTESPFWRNFSRPESREICFLRLELRAGAV